MNVVWMGFGVTGNEGQAGGHLQDDSEQGYTRREAHSHEVRQSTP